MQCKSMDWFLNDRDLPHERVNVYHENLWSKNRVMWNLVLIRYS